MKSIIMVTLDCVRPDHLGWAGYKGVDTPNIDAIAKEGVFFTQAVCQAPNTWVSHASIFTGTNPYRHGVRTPFTPLSPQTKTLAELLSAVGYDTAGFPAHTLMGPGLGFWRGFDHFDSDADQMKFASDSAGHRFYRPWPEMWQRACEWLGSRKEQKKPFYLWLHYMGTHELKPEAIDIPREFLQKYSPVGQYYDAKISWADRECIGSIESFLAQENIKDDVILVLLSDHGDTLTAGSGEGSRGRAFHNKRLSDDVMKIVWLMRNRALLPRGLTVDSQVRSIDMLPTLLDMVNIPIPDWLEGRSLLPMLQGKAALAEPLDAYMENLPQGWLGLRTPAWKLVMSEPKKRFFSFGSKPAVGWRPFALYDLSADPQESIDVKKKHPDVAARLQARLLELVDSGSEQAPSENLDADEHGKIKQKLKELGYID